MPGLVKQDGTGKDIFLNQPACVAQYSQYITCDVVES